MGSLIKVHIQISKEEAKKILQSRIFRHIFIITAFIILIILRQAYESFGISIGYLYLVLISLAGYWFGIKGGILAAIAASSIIGLEMIVFRDWATRAVLIGGLPVRIIVYFFSGIIFGYFFESNKKLMQKLETLAYHDQLTGCVNLTWAVKFLENEIARSKRNNRQVTVVMAGVDNLKSINNRYGHSAGDEVIKAFASLLQENLRKADIVAKYRGDEFLIVFPEIGPEQGIQILNRVRAKLEREKVEFSYLRDKKEVEITFSAGIAYFPYNGDDANDLIDCASSALYQSKITGRNKTLVERRAAIRVKPLPGLKSEIIDSYNKEHVSALDISNISKKGILFYSPSDFTREEFLCRIQFPDEHFASEFTCRIVHKEKCDDSYCVGASFVDMPEYTEERLARYIEKAKDAPYLL